MQPFNRQGSLLSARSEREMSDIASAVLVSHLAQVAQYFGVFITTAPLSPVMA